MSSSYIFGWNSYISEWMTSYSFNDKDYHKGYMDAKKHCDENFGVGRRHPEIERSNKRAKQFGEYLNLHPELTCNTVTIKCN